MENVTDLRNKLLNNIEKLETGELDKALASEIANHAGKVIKSVAVELSYNQFTKQSDKRIKFLEG
jgi:phage-related protein